jgi:hypothetical protein
MVSVKAGTPPGTPGTHPEPHPEHPEPPPEPHLEHPEPHLEHPEPHSERAGIRATIIDKFNRTNMANKLFFET